MNCVCRSIIATLLTLGFSLQSAEAVPVMVAYQGWVQVNGSDYTGTGSFKFAIVNTDGTATYWSQDGTSAAGSEPTGSIDISVDQGLFTVLLGDASVTGMTPHSSKHL